MLAEFEFDGQKFQVTNAFLAPTCAQAAVKAGEQSDVTATLPKGNNCVVIMLNIPDVTDVQKAIHLAGDTLLKLQGSSLVDQDGGKIQQEPFMGGSMPQGNNQMQWRIYFLVKPTGKTFTWILPDGQKIAIIPTE